MSSLVGIIPGQCILATVPHGDEDITNVFKKDQEIVVRYLNLGKLCLFRTCLQNMISEPHNLLFLDFPSVIFYHELRKEKRVKIFVQSILKAGEDCEFYSVINDLSILGCLCNIKAKLNSPFPDFNLGDAVMISCLLPGLDENKPVQGIVRNLKKSSDRLRLGIQFNNPPEKVKEAIGNYLNILQNIA